MNEASDEQKVSIRGWLILIAIIVWFMGVLGALNIILSVLRLFVAIPTTTTPLVMALGIMQSVTSIFLLVLFVKRKRIFITLSVWYLAIAFIYSIFYAVSSPVLTSVHRKVAFYANLVYGAIYVISTIYLLRSKRVKNTFVR